MSNAKHFAVWPLADDSSTSMQQVSIGGPNGEYLWGINQENRRCLYWPDDRPWPASLKDRPLGGPWRSFAGEVKMTSLAVAPSGTGIAVGTDYGLYLWDGSTPDTLTRLTLQPAESGAIEPARVAWYQATELKDSVVWVIDSLGKLYSCTSPDESFDRLVPTLNTPADTVVNVSVGVDGATYAVSSDGKLWAWMPEGNWISLPAPGASISVAVGLGVLSGKTQWCSSAIPSNEDGYVSGRLFDRANVDPSQPANGAWTNIGNPAVQISATGTDEEPLLALIDDRGNVFRGGYQPALEFTVAPNPDSEYSLRVAMSGGSDVDLVWGTSENAPTLPNKKISQTVKARAIFLDAETLPAFAQWKSYRVQLHLFFESFHFGDGMVETVPSGIELEGQQCSLGVNSTIHYPAVFSLLVEDSTTGEDGTLTSVKGSLAEESSGSLLQPPPPRFKPDGDSTRAVVLEPASPAALHFTVVAEE